MIASARQWTPENNDGGDGNLEHGMAIAQLSGVELPAHTEVSSKRDDKVRPFSAQN